MKFEGVDTILFDMDGTLTDLSVRWWEPFFRAHNKVRPDFDYELHREAFEAKIGPIIQHAGGNSRFLGLKIIWKVTRAMKLSVWQTIRLLRHLRQDELAFREIVPLEGAENVVRTLKERGYRLALVTSASWETVEKARSEHDFFNLFDTIVARDDVSQTKPDPESLTKALDRLGSEPGTAVMIGDFPLDVEAGKSAGTATIAVLGPNAQYTRELIEKAHPDVTIELITEVLDYL